MLYTVRMWCLLVLGLFCDEEMNAFS